MIKKYIYGSCMQIAGYSMRINTSQVEAVLMDKTVSAYRLAREIGIQESSISLLRNGKKDFNKLSIEVAMRVQKWIDAGNIK